MALHSLQYLVFLSGSVIAYYATPCRARWIPLLASSCVFYMWWRPEFVLVLLSIAAIQYVLAIRMGQESSKERRWPYLLVSLVAGLGWLVYFKYSTSILLGVAGLVGTFAGGSGFSAPTLLVPIGVSFYTLQTLGYVIDVYQGRRKPETHFGVFLVFVSFFPIVLSGPIERAAHLLPQLQKEERSAFACENICQGVTLIIWGLFLKLVIADRTALYVDAVFGHPDRHSGVTFLVATIFYSFQIYCDFAGYSSVAIGSARLLGIDILPNFNRPYMAVSVKDFWRRWHISLSTWFRDYVFLPLAYAFSRRLTEERYVGIRVDRVVYIAAILATFSLCGLWHGPRLTFLVWGCLHGLYLALENTLRVGSRRRLLGIGRTYLLVLISWVFFRAETVPDALKILQKVLTAPGSLFIPQGADIVAPLYAIGGIGLLLLIELKREFYRGTISLFGHRNEYVRLLAYGLIVALVISMGVFDGGQFIYAQF